jgi:CRISPR-associated endonuclease/helicase Cas3
MEYLAHIRESDKAKQSLEDHLKGVANLAMGFAEIFKAGEWAYLAGLWHDIGKYSNEFQNRLNASSDNNENSETIHGKVDHSTAGAQHSFKTLDQAGKMIAFAIAGHHAGLPDGKSNELSCLMERLQKTIPDFSACPHEYLDDTRKISLPFPLEVKNTGRACFQLWLYIKMIYSSLVDADFLDTEAFMNPDKVTWRAGYPAIEQLWSSLLVALERIKSSSTQINIKRAEILDECLKASELEPGLFSLTVPTGGGKTLSSLAFALKHALKFGMKRIIYVIPYTSIIEQNADVFRKIMGVDSILEHHSNFEPDAEDFRSRLASENWDAPLIVTTNVQFFDSLFACRASANRKLHNIAGSVIILDEAQMLPVPVLKPCLEVLRVLSRHYHASVVLCTATQPALIKRDDFKEGLEDVREIIPDTVSLYNTFKRVKTNILSSISDDELAEKLSGYKQALCIVNKRKHARELYEKIKDNDGTFHLSALMCPVHRTVVLKRIRECLLSKENCRVVSTSLVEAGVDIDFPVVYRAVSGVDSITQAAGRCNREGRLEKPGQVFVFSQEGSSPPGFQKLSAQTAELVLRRHEDPLSLEAVEDYFRSLYWLKGDGLDGKGILADLAEGMNKGDFPFRVVAGKFRIIEELTDSVIIPFNNDAFKVINELRFSEYPSKAVRKAQRYCVQIHRKALARLISAGSVEVIHDQYYVLTNMDIYRDDIGLFFDDPTFRSVEGLII